MGKRKYVNFDRAVRMMCREVLLTAVRDWRRLYRTGKTSGVVLNVAAYGVTELEHFFESDIFCWMCAICGLHPNDVETQLRNERIRYLRNGGKHGRTNRA